MLKKSILILSLFFTNCFSEGFFDFWSGENVENTSRDFNRRDIDINRDFRGGVSKVKRDDTLIEFIPYLTLGYSKLSIDYDNSVSNTKAIDTKASLGFTLNTGFNYFANTKFGYMFNFNYESYNFDYDEDKGTVQSDISGSVIKISPILFYSFDIENVSIYTGVGYGLSKFDLKGTNNFNNSISIDDFSALSVYKVEVLYGRYILTALQENMNVGNNSYDSDLNEIHITLGYLISF